MEELLPQRSSDLSSRLYLSNYCKSFEKYLSAAKEEEVTRLRLRLGAHPIIMIIILIALYNEPLLEIHQSIYNGFNVREFFEGPLLVTRNNMVSYIFLANYLIIYIFQCNLGLQFDLKTSSGRLEPVMSTYHIFREYICGRAMHT